MSAANTLAANTANGAWLRCEKGYLARKCWLDADLLYSILCLWSTTICTVIRCWCWSLGSSFSLLRCCYYLVSCSDISLFASDTWPDITLRSSTKTQSGISRWTVSITNNSTEWNDRGILHGNESRSGGLVREPYFNLFVICHIVCDISQFLSAFIKKECRRQISLIPKNYELSQIELV